MDKQLLWEIFQRKLEMTEEKNEIEYVNSKLCPSSIFLLPDNLAEGEEPDNSFPQLSSNRWPR